MVVFAIGDALAPSYKGCGHAVAAVRNGELVAFSYMRDLIPDFEPDHANEYVADEQIGSFINKWRDACSIHFGMVSSWEFCEL